jgi:hypothetical protein
MCAFAVLDLHLRESHLMARPSVSGILFCKFFLICIRVLSMVKRSLGTRIEPMTKTVVPVRSVGVSGSGVGLPPVF